MNTQIEPVQQGYADLFKVYWQANYRAYCQGKTVDPEAFALHQHMVLSVREQAQPPGIPAAVLESYRFYHQQVEERDSGVVTLAHLPVANLDTFAVWVTTDGDDGWLELFDAQGQELGNARTYVELLMWGPKAEIRAMVQTGGYAIAQAELTAKTLWGK